jgi:hypothetical protein
MFRYRLKVALLALGVVFGYGSGFARLYYGHQYYGHQRGAAHCFGGWGAWDEGQGAAPTDDHGRVH